MGVEPPSHEKVLLFDQEGRFNIGLETLASACGLGRFVNPTSSSGGKRTLVKQNVSALKGVIGDFVYSSWQKPATRKMLIFFFINLMFMQIEMGYGVYVNSLGLISDAFHMLSDCFSIFVALIAAYISTGEADKIYTYGYKRIEILAGLFNAIFLVFVAFNVFCESFERFLEP